MKNRPNKTWNMARKLNSEQNKKRRLGDLEHIENCKTSKNTLGPGIW